MYSLGKEERKKKMEEVLDLLELKGKENIPLSDVPEGVRRRFEVARGFMTYPEVVFLDEPTIGFDIKARMDLWDQIKRAKEKEGTTVILTTHFIDEADYLCDRVMIIDQAKIVALDTPDKLKEAVGADLISLEVMNHDNDAFIERIKELAWVKNVEQYGNSLSLSVEGHDGRVPEIIDFADQNGFQITSIDEHKPSLEDVFLHFTGRTIREAEGSDRAVRAKRRRR
jgi:ABC-2 type transport system ATP-binding protein